MLYAEESVIAAPNPSICWYVTLGVIVMVDVPPVAVPKLTVGCFASSSDCVPVVSTTVTD